MYRQSPDAHKAQFNHFKPKNMDVWLIIEKLNAKNIY